MLRLEPLDDRDVKQFTFCSNPYNKVILNSVGDVSMCCHQFTPLGHLDGNTEVLDLWRSKLAQDIRNETSAGDLHPVCGKDTACPYILGTRNMGHVQTCRRNSFPKVLEICLPDKHCNVGGENPSDDNPACIMCIRNFRKPEQMDLTDFLCEKAKPLMPYLRQICVLGIAEPFWKGAVFDILEKLEFFRYKDRIQFFTNTNGTCLGHKTALRFFEDVQYSDLAWSLDSATKETHLKIRRLDTFQVVVDNLVRWLKLRKEYVPGNHIVSIYNNINLLNVHEMTKMVEMAVAIGVDKMTMLPTYDQAGVVQLGELVLCEKNLKLFTDESERAMDRARQLGLNLAYPKRFDVVPPPVEP